MVDDGRGVPPFAARGVFTIAGLVALLHCTATAFGTGYWFDEVYMLAFGRYHLDWGSADQPPLTPAVAALADAVAPGSMIALRLPTILATAGAVVLAGHWLTPRWNHCSDFSDDWMPSASFHAACA